MTIFIIEDDLDIREMESYALRNSGFDVMEFEDAEGFYQACKENLPDLVVMDIMLPKEDGLSILKKLRANPETQQIPIMMVTAKGTELDKVRGLDMGADDYLSKPFGVMEFISRVKALLRRTPVTQQTVSPLLVCGGISMDDSRHRVLSDGEVCELTYKEYELLKLLLINQSIVLTREKILDSVWGYGYEGESRTVDMHIKTLRQKLKQNGSAIKTVRNVGYKLEA